MVTSAVAPNVVASLLLEINPAEDIEAAVKSARDNKWHDTNLRRVNFKKKETVDSVNFIVKNNALTKQQVVGIIKGAFEAHEQISGVTIRLYMPGGRILGYTAVILVFMKS